MSNLEYDFIKNAARIINSGQTRSIVFTGNISDLFYSNNQEGEDYVTFVELILNKWSVSGSLLVIYELNGPIRFLNKVDAKKMKDAWGKFHDDENQQAIDLALARTKKQIAELRQSPRCSFDECLQKASDNPTYALEFLRQMCLCSRLSKEGEPFLWENLVIIIEGADFLIPNGEIGNLSDVDRQRIAICRDWFSDPGFFNSQDTVILLTESISLINDKIARLPQIIEIEVPSPDEEQRFNLIKWFNKKLPLDKELKFSDSQETLAKISAGLSSHALFQLLRSVSHSNTELNSSDVILKVEEYIKANLGEDVVEFKKPEHKLSDVIGFKKLKEFMKKELIPRIRSTGKSALSGAAIGGPIGSGKSFLLEAVAGELGIVVLVLKNIRSKWFGETDIIFERLKRIIYALDKSLIFVDEADTQFGGISKETHETERRLTGKIQAMMSDPILRGKTTWLLITARIHLLSPDLRRPGRAGSLIIPVLDPEDQDLDDFISWMIQPVFKETQSCANIIDAAVQLKPHINGYYAATFSEIRSDLIAKAELNKLNGLTIEEIKEVIEDHIPAAVEKTRKYQKLQALINCTRLSLLPISTDKTKLTAIKEGWLKEIRELEAEGIE